MGIRPDEEGEKQNKRQGIPDELAEIFEKQEQQLLEQQKQILKQQQEFILQQFEEQRKALATIQRQVCITVIILIIIFVYTFLGIGST